MDTKKIIIIASSVLLVGAGIGAFMYFKGKRKESEEEVSDLGETKKVIDDLGGGVSSPSEDEYSEKQKVKGSSYPLKVGSKGRRVALLQAILQYNGADIGIDGAFGNETRYALLKEGFPNCSIAKYCNISKTEYGALVVEIQNKEDFKNQFNINNNLSMKKVWDKYSS